jgi:hypothetical protein
MKCLTISKQSYEWLADVFLVQAFHQKRIQSIITNKIKLKGHWNGKWQP